jgi:hypothetical protein
VKTVTDLGKRSAGDVEKLELFALVIARASFDDVYRDGESGAPCLRTKLESFEARKRLMRQHM